MIDDKNKKVEEEKVEEKVSTPDSQSAEAPVETAAEEKVDAKEESLVASGEQSEPVEEKIQQEPHAEEVTVEPEIKAPEDKNEDKPQESNVIEESLDASGEEEPADATVLQAEEPVETKTEEPKTPSPSDNAKWYIVHTYSGHENKVAKSLRQRIESMGFENRIFDIIVPTRDTVKVSQGKKENIKEKIFPGYVLIKMILDDESWLLVRTTQGVTAFIGAGNKPTPISDKEVEAIQKFMATEEPLYKASFTVGEAVKIVDGPFADFLGTIDNIDEAKGKLKVLVSIFGRETPVELDFLQVTKL